MFINNLLFLKGVDKKKLYKKHKERKSKNIDIYLDPYDEVIGCYQLGMFGCFIIASKCNNYFFLFLNCVQFAF